MRIAFYITNHGFGHASRNVPIIEYLLNNIENCIVDIKSDQARCNFLKRNLKVYKNINYYNDCKENGLVLQEGRMDPDVELMKKVILEDFEHWNNYIEREKEYMLENKPDIVVADVVCWAIKAAKDLNIKTLLIGNFSWAQMYKHFYDEEIWKPYYDYYCLADKALWYEIHVPELNEYCKDTENISFVSRDINHSEVQSIKNAYKKPIVFISNGASADFKEEIDVSELPYDFLVTRGLHFIGDNVYELPLDMINTPDYIAAADYVISKGGWSTVAEILLQRKKCALIYRGNNSEDNNTRQYLEPKEHCISICAEELRDIQTIINRIDELNPKDYNIYHDDTEKIGNIIINMGRKKENKNDTI